jgi:hypothetical protein
MSTSHQGRKCLDKARGTSTTLVTRRNAQVVALRMRKRSVSQGLISPRRVTHGVYSGERKFYFRHVPGIPFSRGRKSFQNAQAVVRGPLPKPFFSAFRIKYCGWSLV